MTRLPLSILGVALALAATALLLARSSTAPRPSPPRTEPTRLVEDCEGAIEQLVVHYTPEATDTVLPIYREFFRQLSDEVVVHVVCSTESDFDELQRKLNPVPCRLSAVPVGHAITSWSRDRWLALRHQQDARETTILCPQSEMGADIWPARAGDQQVAEDLARLLQDTDAVRSRLDFDGGDFVADSEIVFAARAVSRRNLGRVAATRDQLRELLESRFGRPVVLLEQAPDHHAGMFMMPVGNRTMLVGDPAAGKRLWQRLDKAQRREIDLPGNPDFSNQTIQDFEAVARRCREAGCRVERIPTVISDDGRTYLTYLNAILEQRNGQRIVYMPVYSGAAPLNEEAVRTWTNLGYDVRPIDCTSCFRHFGTLRCLVNVLRRR